MICSSEVEGLELEFEFESGVCQTPELVLFVLRNVRPEKLSPSDLSGGGGIRDAPGVPGHVGWGGRLSGYFPSPELVGTPFGSRGRV